MEKQNPKFNSCSHLFICGTPPPIYNAIGYKIIAVDNTDQESIFSDRAKLTAVAPNSCSCGEDNISLNEFEEKNLTIKNFPNPFNPTTQISYSIPSDANVKIEVFNMLGQSVMTIVNNEYKTKGIHQITFNGETFSTGIYFVKIQSISGNNQSIKFHKLMLVK